MAVSFGELPFTQVNGIIILKSGTLTGSMKKIQKFCEEHAFGVCTRLGEKLGVATSSIRLFFIYVSCLTFGSPLIVYLVLAFIMDMRKHLRRNSSTVWDF